MIVVASVDTPQPQPPHMTRGVSNLRELPYRCRWTMIASQRQPLRPARPLLSGGAALLVVQQLQPAPCLWLQAMLPYLRPATVVLRHHHRSMWHRPSAWLPSPFLYRLQQHHRRQSGTHVVQVLQQWEWEWEWLGLGEWIWWGRRRCRCQPTRLPLLLLLSLRYRPHHRQQAFRRGHHCPGVSRQLQLQVRPLQLLPMLLPPRLRLLRLLYR